MKTTIVLFLAVAGIGAACATTKADTTDGPSTTTITGARVSTNDRAISLIAGARCDREAACDNVGDGHRWATKDECLSEVKQDLRSKLNAKTCPNGVEQRHLDECVKDARTERCGNPIDSIGRASSCTRSELCLKK